KHVFRPSCVVKKLFSCVQAVTVLVQRGRVGLVGRVGRVGNQSKVTVGIPTVLSAKRGRAPFSKDLRRKRSPAPFSMEEGDADVDEVKIGAGIRLDAPGVRDVLETVARQPLAARAARDAHAKTRLLEEIERRRPHREWQAS